MAFRYPLESVLRLRRGLERQEEQRLTAIVAVVARLRAEIAEFERVRLEQRRTVLQELTAGCSGAMVQFGALCDSAAESMARRLQTQLAEAEGKRLEQLGVYQTARQKREILEGLRERQAMNHARETARREQERLDEGFLVRYAAGLRE